MKIRAIFFMICIVLVCTAAVVLPAFAEDTATNETQTTVPTTEPTVAQTTVATTATPEPTQTTTQVVTTTATTVATTTATIVQPVAGFSGTPTSGSASLTVQFTDSSMNSPTSWSWDFGDGDTSSEQSPSHTYTTAGTYSVSLTATNSAGSNYVTQSSYIVVSAVTPATSFSGSPVTGAAPLTVYFTDASTNTPTSWIWEFGDGNTSTVQDPSFTYTTAGTYSVALTATNSAGSNVYTLLDYITVTDTLPVASFSAIPTSGTTPLTVYFTDASTNTPTSWGWEFGDGGTSSLQNPSYTYTTAGTYSVSLVATNDGGSNLITQSNYITVSASTIVTSAPVYTITSALPPTYAIKSVATTKRMATSLNDEDAVLAESGTDSSDQDTDILTAILNFFKSLFSWI